MMNYAFLVGRIAGEAQTRKVEKAGEPTRTVTTFKLITHKFYKNQERTEAHDVEAWGEGLATLFTKRYLTGDAVGFVGTSRHDHWQDASGVHHNRTWVVLSPDAEIALVHRAARNKGQGSEG